MHSSVSSASVASSHATSDSHEEVEGNVATSINNLQSVQQSDEVSKKVFEESSAAADVKVSSKPPVKAKVMHANDVTSGHKARSCCHTAAKICEGMAMLVFGAIGMVATLPLTLVCVPPCTCVGACLGEFCGEIFEDDDTDTYLSCNNCCSESDGAAWGASCGVMGGSLGTVFCAVAGYDTLKEVCTRS